MSASEILFLHFLIIYTTKFNISVCSNTTMQPIAIFGPQNSVTDNIIRDQCYVSNIPHIQANLQLADPDMELNPVEATDEESTEDQGLKFKKISINFYPPAEDILYAYAMLLKYYKWKNFAVLYEDDLGKSFSNLLRKCSLF